MTIEQVKQKYEQQLLSLPNVVGVGIGEKERKEVILVFVRHKISQNQLKPHEVIPKTLEGYEIQVTEIGDIITS